MKLFSSADAVCRVCGYKPEDPPWGADGRTPLFEFCSCCGVEWGYQDATSTGVARFRAQWLESGARWADPAVEFDGLSVGERLRRVISV